MIELCKTASEVPSFLRNTCLNLECCPNLVSLHQVEDSCPEQCFNLNKSKYSKLKSLICFEILLTVFTRLAQCIFARVKKHLISKLFNVEVRQNSALMLEVIVAAILCTNFKLYRAPHSVLSSQWSTFKCLGSIYIHTHHVYIFPILGHPIPVSVKPFLYCCMALKILLYYMLHNTYKLITAIEKNIQLEYGHSIKLNFTKDELVYDFCH